jgi:succinyl-diaminopimelate desuccinylase
MIDVLQRQPSGSTEETHPEAVSLARCVAEVEGEEPRFEMCPGSLDTRWYAQLGIPAFAYGAGRLDVSHGAEEFIDEAAMGRGVRALRRGGATVIPAAPGTET